MYSDLIMPQTFSERVGRAIRARSGYHAFVPKPLPPEINYSPTLIRLVGEAEHALGELAGVGSLLPNPRFLSVPAVLREAVLSSRIEGTHTNVDELLMYESGEREITDAADAREVHNYVVALEYGLARLDTLPLSLRLIREIHERLMDGGAGGRRPARAVSHHAELDRTARQYAKRGALRSAAGAGDARITG